MNIFTGLGIAMATPLRDDGIDFKATERLTDYYISEGADALIALGTTGEASTMSIEEREAFVRCVRSRCKLPLIVGTSSNNTATAIELSKRAAIWGADALLVATPYYNKCTKSGLIAHYKAVCDATPLPVIAYNVPGRTGFNITPIAAAELINAGVVAIKEASGNMHQMSETIRLLRGKAAVYCGDDALNLPAASIGAEGVISVLGGVVPRLVKRLLSQTEQAVDLHHALSPLVDALFAEVNPVPLKACLSLIGHPVGEPRLPLTKAEPSTVLKLRAALDRLTNL